MTEGPQIKVMGKVFPASLIFLIIPTVYLCTALLYIFLSGLHYMGGVDPEYNYLFNGITMAHLKFHLNAVGHPGTPIQCLITLVSWVVHLFRPGQSLWDDVMLNPELYIKATVVAGNAINWFFLFLLGVQVFRITQNKILALFLQVTPFSFLMTLEVSYRMMPELIMASIISLWIIFLVKMLYETHESRNYKKYSFIFAILAGFSLADKLTFLPLVFLPLFLLPQWKLRLRYVLIMLVAFMVFAFPAMLNFNKFTGWVTDLFTHKGTYGSGEKGIIDWPVFIGNLKIMIQNSTTDLDSFDSYVVS